jgi:CubicO group peptidase (beta-lactamase class C family)
MSPGQPHAIYSTGKSLLTLLAGILVEEGVVGLDDPVSDHLPALSDSAVYGAARVKDCMNMASGLSWNQLGEQQGRDDSS